MRKSRYTLLALVVAVGWVITAGCDSSPEGSIEVHWSVNGGSTAAACGDADVTRIRVLADHMGTEIDDDLVNPPGTFMDFDCADLMGRIDLTEGLYRLRIIALDDAGGDAEIRSQIVEFLSVEVIDGVITRIPQNPELEPPIDIEVAVCGDGVAQQGEWCDASDLAGNDCTTLGHSGGELSCAADCTFDDSLCTICGDDTIDAAEACDGSDLGGASCVSLGFDSGELMCAADCGALDMSGCVGCGNGTVEAAEECDDGNLDSGDGCSADCRLEVGSLDVTWTTYNTGGQNQSCAQIGIDTVDATVTLAGVGTVVHTETVDCSVGGFSVPDVYYGLYTVELSGLDAGSAIIATGASAVTDHSDPAGTDIPIDLTEL